VYSKWKSKFRRGYFAATFGIVDDLIDENGLSPGMLFYWMMWIVFCGVSFIGVQRAKKKEGLS